VAVTVTTNPSRFVLIVSDAVVLILSGAEQKATGN
jgi:hypothetical protein